MWSLRIFSPEVRLRHFEVPLGHTCIFGDNSRQRNEPRTEIVAREGRELIQKKSGTHSKQDIVFNIIIYIYILYIIYIYSHI